MTSNGGLRQKVVHHLGMKFQRTFWIRGSDYPEKKRNYERMSALSDMHFRLIDETNDAKTEQDYLIAQAKLDGFRIGIQLCNRHISFIDADIHTMERFGGDVPMCGGVLIREWK